MKKRVFALILCAIMTLGLVACGQSSTQSTTASESAETVQEDGGQLAAIKAAGKLVIGTEGTYPPLTYHNEAGELVGFDVEVARAIADYLGVEAEFVETDWDSLIAGLQAGRFDCVLNEVTPTEERRKTYDFSQPYTYIHNVAITMADNDEIHSFEDLAGKKVSNTISSTHAQIAESYGAEVVAVDTFEASIEMVLTGRADATINSELVFNDYITQKPDSGLKIAAIQEESDTTAVPVRKGEQEFLDAINEAIDALRANGTLKEISERYFGMDITKEN